MRHEVTAFAHLRIKEGNQGKSRKRELARDEELDSIVREPSTHKRKASIRPSWDVHSSSCDTHGLEGPRAWH